MNGPNYRLIEQQGPTPGQIFPLVKAEIKIGRELSNDLAINDAEVSRRHAIIRFEGGKYVIEDLGSTNGTFINGQSLTGSHVLQIGELITLGENVVLRFDVDRPDLAATTVSSVEEGVDLALAPKDEGSQESFDLSPEIVPVYPPASEAGEPYLFRDDEASEELPDVRSSRDLWLISGCGCLVLLAVACAAAVLAIEYYNLWCTLFGSLIPGC